MSFTRREFIGGFLGAAAIASAASVKPELILYNGNFYTMDPANPRAEAVAIANGRFLAVGSKTEIDSLSSAGAMRVDLGGDTVLPGFIDAHAHGASVGMNHLRNVNCNLPSIAAIQEAIRKRAEKIGPGQWVTGFMYDDTKTKDGRQLTIADLDAAAPNNPVIISHRGGHLSWVNSKALEVADVNDKTPDPHGGAYGHNPDGKLNGRVLERAVAVFIAKNKVAPPTRAERQQAAVLVTKMFVASGITSFHDPLGSPDDLRAYQDAHEAGELPVRVYCSLHESHIEKMIAAGIRTGLGDEWVKVGFMKIVADGAISGRTARLSQPYVGRPNDYGILAMDEKEIYERARIAHAAGWQIGTHANGDVTIDMVLRVYERLQKEIPRKDPRLRIEHCSLINDDLVRRIKALGVIPNPFSTYVYYHGEKMKDYGPERLEHMFALRTFLDNGIPATEASDYLPGPFEPMMALQSEVTRTDRSGNVWGSSQRISVDEAIRVGTVNGAHASFDENLKGSIQAGKLADLVVLGQDPHTIDPSTLVNIPIHRTMVGGQWRFEA
jgi:predicted amidohydrolase YtcJ